MRFMFKPASESAEAQEDAQTNASADPTIGDIFLERMSRRDLMSAALAVTAVSLILAGRAACGYARHECHADLRLPRACRRL